MSELSAKDPARARDLRTEIRAFGQVYEEAGSDADLGFLEGAVQKEIGAGLDRNDVVAMSKLSLEDVEALVAG